MICDFTGEKAIPETCLKCSFYIPAHCESVSVRTGFTDDDGIPIYEDEIIEVDEDCAK